MSALPKSTESRTTPTPTGEPPPLAVGARQLGKMLGLSLRTVRKLDASRKLPRPIRIGGAVRWSVCEIERWIEAGAPDRRTWEVLERAHHG